MSSQFYIFIDSRNKLYGTNSSMTVETSEFNLQPGLSTAVSVEQVTFMSLQYPVNSTNNTFTWAENSDPTVITSTLPEGAYSADEFATLLQTTLNNDTLNSNVYTVTFNSNRSKLNISTLLPDTFRIISMNEVFGFNTMSSYLAVKEADDIVDISGVNYVDLLFTGLLTGNMTTSRTNVNGMIYRIPINVGFGDLVNYRSEEPDDALILDHSRLSQLTIELRNPDGTRYQLPDNSHLSITLKCQYVGNV